MSTAFPEGYGTPLYTWGSMCAVVFFMIIAQIDFRQLWRAGERLYTKYEISLTREGPFMMPVGLTFALVVLALYFASEFWIDTPASPTWGFKVVWVTASVTISLAPVLVLMPYYWWLDTTGEVSMGFGYNLRFATTEKVRALVGLSSYYKFVFAVHYVCLAVLIIMSMLCLFMFPAGGTQYSSIARSGIVATGCMIFVILLGDMVQKILYGKEDTDTKGLIRNMVANKRAYPINLDALPKPAQTAGFASLPPLTFARTQGIGFARDDPVHLLAHQVENQVIRPNTKTTLGIKDYQVFQTNENQAVVVSSEDGNTLMNAVPGAELNFERHGMLAPVNHFGEAPGETVVDRTVEKHILTLTEGEQRYTDKFFFRIFDKEPSILVYENYVLGLAKGNGIYMNTPGFLPIFLSAYLLAVEIQIWRSTGIGLMVSVLTLLPCFVFCYISHERSYLPLFFLNRLLAYFVILAQYNIAYVAPNYILAPGVLTDTTSVWLFNSTVVTNADDVVTVNVTTWFALSLAIVWMIGSAVKLFSVVTVK